MTPLRARAGFALALAALVLAPAAAAQQPAPPKTIILGFDGMDHALTAQFMAEGLMPSFTRLAEGGVFQRLETSNPAQSPVSWAVFNTGCNPGKTGVAGFVSREFKRGTGPDGVKLRTGPAIGPPLPQPMLGFHEPVPADDFVRFPMAMHQPRLFEGGAAAGAFLAVLLLARLALRLPAIVAALLALAAGAGAFSFARDYAGSLPADGKLPYIVNPMQGTSFWHYLDERGIRLRGIQVASTFPPDAEGPNTKLLAGLGVPDIGGSTGSWSVFTNTRWLYADKDTPSGGWVYKLYEDEPNVLQAKLPGPSNWVRAAETKVAVRDIARRLEDASLPAAEADELKARRAELEREGRKAVSVPFTMRLDKAQHVVHFEIGGRTLSVAQGAWSDFVPVEFPMNERYVSKGLATFHVVRCDEEEVRVFVPPINIDPDGVPPQLPISAPHAFAAQLRDEIGHHYETIGWACLTNPIKDIQESELPEQSFLDDIVTTEALREELLMAGLERADEWDVYFQVFSTPDRVGHMLFRERDEGHPFHDAETAAEVVNAWGRSFPLRDALREVYRDEDRLLGRVLDQLEAGDFGDDCLLLVVSDHGFSSFRRQVNLNNVLAELGHLVFTEGLDAAKIVEGGRRYDYLQFVDWSRTKAYSLGLGEVFINLQGREPLGIVPPGEYDALVERIRGELLALTDPKGGAQVVTSVSRRDELYSGPWWKEGRATRKVRGVPVEYDHDGFADLFMGYRPLYRVAWSNTTGALSSAAITDNDNRWSGDHVSVDPSHVPGILLSNRALPPGTEAGLMDIAPTVLRRYGIDPTPPHTEMDGRALPFAGPRP